MSLTSRRRVFGIAKHPWLAGSRWVRPFTKALGSMRASAKFVSRINSFRSRHRPWHRVTGVLRMNSGTSCGG